MEAVAMVTSHACLGVAPNLRPTLGISILPPISSCNLRSSRRTLQTNSWVCGAVCNDSQQQQLSVRRAVLCRASEPPSRPTQEPVKTVSVIDDEGKLDAVIQVDRDEAPQPTWGRIYALIAGDAVFLLLFAAIGRVSHGLPVLDWDLVRTADPFLAGWFAASYFIGGYGPEGQGLKGLKVASLAAVKSWAVGVPLAFVIRGFEIGRVPAAPFMAVSLASIFVLQVGWRTAFTVVFPNDEQSFQKRKGDRKGDFFEFFELLTSLVKRW